jgi:DNA-binding transcriptional regulator YhcF (GntR family)
MVGMSALAITVDASSGTPPFEQVRGGIRSQITDGSLAAGFRLPPVRSLADELGLAPNTIARAYRELEAAGFLETRGRAGTFVAATGDPREREGQRAARAFADRMTELGVTPSDALEWARRALEG